MLRSGPSLILVSIASWLARRLHPFLTYDDLKPVNHIYVTFHLDDHYLLANLEKLPLVQNIDRGPCGEVGYLGIFQPILVCPTPKS